MRSRQIGIAAADGFETTSILAGIIRQFAVGCLSCRE
jgi:hypothetical protein